MFCSDKVCWQLRKAASEIQRACKCAEGILSAERTPLKSIQNLNLIRNLRISICIYINITNPCDIRSTANVLTRKQLNTAALGKLACIKNEVTWLISESCWIMGSKPCLHSLGYWWGTVSVGFRWISISWSMGLCGPYLCQHFDEKYNLCPEKWALSKG